MEDFVKEREQLCKTCESSAGWFCKECSCVLPVKIRIASSNCPKNKWHSLKTDNYSGEMDNERR